MADFDYRSSIEKDTLEQFRGQPNIEVLHNALARQLQEVYEFFAGLGAGRSLSDAVGVQLDGIGDIVVLTREEATELAKAAKLGEATDDEIYRKYLIYKVLKNTNNCTYPDLIKAFRMFWNQPLYYREDPEYPATIFLDTGKASPYDHPEGLLTVPIIKAGGVGIHVTATAVLNPETVNIYACGGVTALKEIVDATVHVPPLIPPKGTALGYSIAGLVGMRQKVELTVRSPPLARPEGAALGYAITGLTGIRQKVELTVQPPPLVRPEGKAGTEARARAFGMNERRTITVRPMLARPTGLGSTDCRVRTVNVHESYTVNIELPPHLQADQ